MDVDFKRFEPQNYSSQRENDQFAQAFNVLLNYWEIKPSQYEAKLHEMALKDIRTVCAFVPWSHVETDIYHSLKKFLRAAHSVKMKVRLFVMPELGVNYPNSGVPREVLHSNSSLAVGRRGQIIYNYAAPNIFPLPSFFAPEVLKRFGNYLIKFGSVLSDAFQEAGSGDFCEVVVSNSFFNYYRNFGLKPSEHGDYSASHVMAFREFLDREYPGGAGEPFKMQVYEPLNRHRFFSHVEKTLREKTEMIFSRKKSQCNIRHVDLLNPECAPEAGYQSLLVEMFDFKPSVERFYEAIVAAGDRGESVFLNSSGVFRRFSDQEKSFLVMASLIHSSDVVVSYDEVVRLSASFQRKLGELISVLKEQSFIPHRRMTYVAASKFAMHEQCYSLLSKMAPGVMSLATGLTEEASNSARHYKDTAHSAGISEAAREAMQYNKRLLFIDPQSIIRMIDLVQMFSLAQVGKVVAIPAPFSKLPNYMPDAMTHLEKFRKVHKALKIGLGISYEVYEYQLGFVVLYNPDIFWTLSNGNKSSPAEESAARSNLALFFQALLGLSEIKSICQVNDPRIHVVSYVSQNDSGTRLLFLVNSSREPINARLQFTETVGLGAVGSNDGEGECIVGKSFELAVPPLGVLSMKLIEPSATQLAQSKTASGEDPLGDAPDRSNTDIGSDVHQWN